jgi:hypothetical protein
MNGARAMIHRMIVPAIIFLALGIVARPACACQCERFSTCTEVAATSLVFIGTVESIEPLFLNRWNDTSQSSLRSLNDAFVRAQEHPSADALTALKDAYLKTFPDVSPDRKSKIQNARTASGVAALFYSNVGRGMRIRFRVQTVFKHQDDDDDGSSKQAHAPKAGKDKDQKAEDDDDRKPGSAKTPPPGRAAQMKGPENPQEKPEEKEAEDLLEVWTPFGECGVSFQTGETYLVFASDDEETSDSIATDSCTRTRRLSEAGEDLAYLYFYKEHPEESTRIDGYATTNSRYRLDFSPLHPERIQPLVRNVVIELKSGDLRRFTETDQNGHFVFDGLPAGDYTLAAYDSDYPKGKQLLANPQPVHLQPKSCSLQILVLSKGEGQGENSQVDLVPASAEIIANRK